MFKPYLRHQFTAVLLFLFSCFTLAQVSIQANLVPGVSFSSSDALGCTISSTTTVPFKIKLVAHVQQVNGGKISVLTSETMLLQPGITVIDPNVLPFSIRYLNNDLGFYEQTNSHLPAGNYQYCVQLFCLEKNCSEFINLEQNYSDCNEVDMPNSTPLMLSSPDDEAQIEDCRPNFTWIPPMPIGSDPNISYAFTLVELREKQSAENGISRNRPLYNLKGIKGINQFFPAELQDLTRGNRYAWQVVAYLGHTPIQSSEVWEFEIIKPEEDVQPMPFVRLKTTDDRIYSALNELKFIYTNEGNATSLDYTIYTIDNKRVKMKLPELPLVFGENTFEMKLADYHLEHKQEYILKVKNANKEVYVLKFRFYYKP